MRRSTRWHDFHVWLSYSIKAWFPLLCSHFCIYLTAELLVNTQHTHVAVCQDLRYLTAELLWASYRRGIAVAADTDRWLTVTQTERRELKRKRGWESERREEEEQDGQTGLTRVYRVSPKNSSSGTHADAKNLCTVLLRLCESTSLCVYVWCLEFHGAILFWSVLIASFMVTFLRIEWTEQQQRDRNRRREGEENRKKRRSKSKGSEGFREIYIWWIFERFKAPRPKFSLLTETKANRKHQGEEKGKWEKESERDFYT